MKNTVLRCLVLLTSESQVELDGATCPLLRIVATKMRFGC